MQLTGAQSIALRVWERGAGETLACGTGACAAAVSAIRQERVSSPVRVRMRGGEVTIAWQPGQTVRMTGPAETVFEGEVDLDLDFEGDFGSVTTSDVARASVTLSPSSGAVITSHSAGLGGRGAGEGSRP
jgi:hypothetical protein